MALGLGRCGEQNAPLGRAVIGGLLLATVATLFFVPAFSRRPRLAGRPPRDGSRRCTAGTIDELTSLTSFRSSFHDQTNSIRTRNRIPRLHSIVRPRPSRSPSRPASAIGRALCSCCRLPGGFRHLNRIQANKVLADTTPNWPHPRSSPQPPKWALPSTVLSSPATSPPSPIRHLCPHFRIFDRWTVDIGAKVKKGDLLPRSPAPSRPAACPAEADLNTAQATANNARIQASATRPPPIQRRLPPGHGYLRQPGRGHRGGRQVRTGQCCPAARAAVVRAGLRALRWSSPPQVDTGQ